MGNTQSAPEQDHGVFCCTSPREGSSQNESRTIDYPDDKLAEAGFPAQESAGSKTPSAAGTDTMDKLSREGLVIAEAVPVLAALAAPATTIAGGTAVTAAAAARGGERSESYTPGSGHSPEMRGLDAISAAAAADAAVGKPGVPMWSPTAAESAQAAREAADQQRAAWLAMEEEARRRERAEREERERKAQATLMLAAKKAQRAAQKAMAQKAKTSSKKKRSKKRRNKGIDAAALERDVERQAEAAVNAHHGLAQNPAPVTMPTALPVKTSKKSKKSKKKKRKKSKDDNTGGRGESKSQATLFAPTTSPPPSSMLIDVDTKSGESKRSMSQEQSLPGQSAPGTSQELSAFVLTPVGEAEELLGYVDEYLQDTATNIAGAIDAYRVLRDVREVLTAAITDKPHDALRRINWEQAETMVDDLSEMATEAKECKCVFWQQHKCTTVQNLDSLP